MNDSFSKKQKQDFRTIYTLPEKFDGYSFTDVGNWVKNNIPKITQFLGCEIILKKRKEQ